MTAPRRRRIPLSITREVWDRAGGRCELGGETLVSSDQHHVEFYSLGGQNSVDNLTAVCPSCHRQVAHGVYGAADSLSIRAAVARSARLAGLHRIIVSGSGSAQGAATALLDDEARMAMMAKGDYERAIFWCAELLEERSEISAPTVVRLEVLRADMTLYVQQAPDMLQDLVTLHESGRFPEETRRELVFALARQLHRAGSIEEEQERLASLPADETDSEAVFRRTSATSEGKEPRLAPPLGDLSSRGVINTIFTANIIADQGRQKILADDVEGGYADLERSWSMARIVVHRRGMLITGLKLAETAIALREHKLAAI